MTPCSDACQPLLAVPFGNLTTSFVAFAVAIEGEQVRGVYRGPWLVHVLDDRTANEPRLVVPL